MGRSLRFKYHTEGDLSSLFELIKELRGESGCPWDKKQTPETLKKYLLEEAYEAIEAIDQGEPKAVMEELGDLLFLILFIVYIYQERGEFSLKELVEKTFNKMVSRHPHVFGEESAKSAEEVLKRWQVLKAKEGKSPSILGDLPKSLPALQRAYRLGERAGRIGFDWKDPKEVFAKIYEELKEVEMALNDKRGEQLKEELGDLLFSIANLSRKLNINPEEALRGALIKFENRFKRMESFVKEQGKRLEDMTLEEMDKIWETLKKT